MSTDSTSSYFGVIGLGTMGAGIVEVLAKAGHQVVAVDIHDQAVDRGRSIIAKSTGRAVEKGRLSTEDAAALHERITFTTDVSRVAECRLIVEAAFEDADVKKDIFAKLERYAPGAILATNTSSLSVTDIATSIATPERVIGVHFFNPAPVQKLVEVITTPHTSPEVLATVMSTLKGLGKNPIHIADRAGFVVNALLITYLNRAITLYAEGACTRERMDETMVEAGNPMGPLTLADLIGNDVNLAIMRRMHAATGDGRHQPAPLLERMCAEGMLGRKTGRGFYTYDGSDEAPLVESTNERCEEFPLALLAPYLNDACRMVDDGYATPEDINTGMREGCRMPEPFAQLDEWGAPVILETMERLHAETGIAGFAPSNYLRSRAAEASA